MAEVPKAVKKHGYRTVWLALITGGLGESTTRGLINGSYSPGRLHRRTMEIIEDALAALSKGKAKAS